MTDTFVPSDKTLAQTAATSSADTNEHPTSKAKFNLVSHFRKNRLAYALGVGVILLVYLGYRIWFSHLSVSVESVNPDLEALGALRSSADGLDGQILRLFHAVIAQNFSDFEGWYKANIFIQSMIIVFGILSTILAAFSTMEGARRTRLAVVALTAATTALITVQSTFHIKENLDIFIKANSDLETSEFDYLNKSLSSKAASKADLDKLTLQNEALKGMVRVVESRMRAYSTIGAQQERGSSAEANQLGARVDAARTQPAESAPSAGSAEPSSPAAPTPPSSAPP